MAKSLLNILFVSGIFLILSAKSIRAFNILVCLVYDSFSFLIFIYKFLDIYKIVAKIKELYYRVIKQDIRWIIKQYYICVMIVSLEAKTFIIPIITKVFLEYI
jgi:hypothetical protein